MNAQPLLSLVVKAMHKHGLEAILIGNAGAALHGAPVTTLDFDFMFRETPLNMRKLKAVSKELGAVILRPYYPVSKLYRMVDDEQGLQVDFMPVIHGVSSFESLRSRAVEMDVGSTKLKLASLKDIIKSKRAACRLRDRAVLPIIEQTLHEKENANSEKPAKADEKADSGRPRRRK